MEHLFKKKFGQNFLIDNNILNKIFMSISPNEDDLILEIGPGSGNLTKYLKRYRSNLICFEIDTSLSKYLDCLVDDRTRIVYDDFLNVDLDLVVKDISYKNIYVIANIPYYITTPIIEKITFSNLNISSLTLMVQKEVAVRLSSCPGSKDYGYISSFLNAFYDIEMLFNVSRNCFYPVPNVDSAVIRLNSKKCLVENVDSFNKLLKDAFKFKRKNLKNNLYNYDLNFIEMFLNKYGYSLSSRAEDIPSFLFVELSNLIHNKKTLQ